MRLVTVEYQGPQLGERARVRRRESEGVWSDLFDEVALESATKLAIAHPSARACCRVNAPS